MQLIPVFLVSLIYLASIGHGAQYQFDDYKVYTLDVETEEQLKALQEIENADSYEGGYDFWKSPNLGGQAELMVPPFEIPNIRALIKTLGFKSEIKVHNVQKCVEKWLYSKI